MAHCMGKIVQITTDVTIDQFASGCISITALDDGGCIWHKCMYPTGDVWHFVDMTTEFDVKKENR